MTTPIEMESVPVHVTGMETALHGLFSRKRRQYSVVPRTVKLTSDTPVDQLCRAEQNREHIIIIAQTNAVVLAKNKADAQYSGNTASSITAPNGAYLAAGTVHKFACTSELWVATGTYPTLITVIEVINA